MGLQPNPSGAWSEYLPEGWEVSDLLRLCLSDLSYDQAYHHLKHYPADFDAYAYCWRRARVRYSLTGKGRADRFARAHGLEAAH